MRLCTLQTKIHFHIILFFYRFMSTTFNMDPNYWDTLATNELLITSNSDKIINIKY